MKKKILLMILCCMALCLVSCGHKDKKESRPEIGSNSVAEAGQTIIITETESDGESDNNTESDIASETMQESDGADAATKEQAPDFAGRQDGERFEDVIMIEGMSETVKYEHVRNETAGFELDYDYESFERYSGSDSERFISAYDDQNDPVNHLDVKRYAEDSEIALAKMSEDLSKDFNTVVTEQQELDGAGQCASISASDVKAGSIPAGSMRRVYIIPVPDGCVLAEAYFTIESAEGFGARFSDIMNTLTVMNI